MDIKSAFLNEKIKKRRKILKRWFQEDLAQKQEEIDATRDEINKLKGSQKEYLQDKTYEEAKMKAIKNGKAPIDEGFQISQQEKRIFICQAKYIKEILKKFKMEYCKPILTLMVTGFKLSIDETSKDVDQRLYRYMIGSLLYVTASRPDVMQAVGQVPRFQEAPKESHIIVVKIIIRYIKGTIEYGLWYPKGNNLIIQAFTDVDWAGSVDDRKSTSEATLYLGGCLISWLRKTQTSISLSTTEVEYIAAEACCTQVLWMKKTFQDLQVKFDEPIPVFCNNTNAISISKNPMMYSKTNHIPIKYHFVREKVAEKNMKLEYVGTNEKIIDIFTNPLPREAFEYIRQKLGILPSSL
eukprot:PITA_26044